MSQGAIASSSQPASKQPALIPISINGNTLDPNLPALRGALGLGVGDAARSNYILIQTRDYLTQANKDQLRNLEVEVEELVSDRTYLCRFIRKNLQDVREQSFVTWASIYGSQFVVSPALRSDPVSSVATATASLTPSAPAGAREVDVIFHEAHGLSTQELTEVIAEAAHVHPTTLQGTANSVRLVLQDQYLQAVARLDEVRAIVPVIPAKLYNNVARNIMMGRGNVADFEEIRKDQINLDGEGEVVAVADTGIDSGHKAFKGRIVDEQAWGRPEKPARLGRPPVPARTDDPKGHGTHVSGSVLGDGVYKNVAGEEVVVRGTAPKAQLVLQSLLDDDYPKPGLGGIPADLKDLFAGAYKYKARVHNNSWGFTQAGLPYGPWGAQIDQYVRENPDMVICWAAGNEAVDINRNGEVDIKSIGSHSAAKNCITVGASESFRPESGLRYISFPDEDGNAVFQVDPIRTDETADDSEGMAAFSNRGPSQEGRIKPDVVAPGTCILSARSSIAPQLQAWARSEDVTWMYNGGTSMASPLVAGGCALLRQALRGQLPAVEQAKKRPTAALIKALIINGAVELKGQYIPSEAGPSPNFSSGWGRVHLVRSVEMATYARSDAANGCHEAEVSDDIPMYKRNIEIGGSGRTLKITLVWTDMPGEWLQNDLDLTVTIGGNTRRGDPTTDQRNNVQQVYWTDVPGATAEVRVNVRRLTRGDQPFALAWMVE